MHINWNYWCTLKTGGGRRFLLGGLIYVLEWVGQPWFIEKISLSIDHSIFKRYDYPTTGLLYQGTQLIGMMRLLIDRSIEPQLLQISPYVGRTEFAMIRGCTDSTSASIHQRLRSEGCPYCASEINCAVLLECRWFQVPTRCRKGCRQGYMPCRNSCFFYLTLTAECCKLNRYSW